MLNKLPLHPLIYEGVNKELHIFDQLGRHGDNGDIIDRCSLLQQYNNLLLGSKKRQGIVDKTPEYVVDSHVVPQRIFCVFPNAKFILLLRNPTDRAYSQYQMEGRWAARDGKTDYPSFEEFLNPHIASLNSTGLLNADLTPQEKYKLWSESAWEARSNFVGKGLFAIQVRQYMSILGAILDGATFGITCLSWKQKPVGKEKQPT